MATAELIQAEAAQRKIVVADRAVRDALDRYIADSFPDSGRDGFVKAMGNKGVSEAEVLSEFAQIQTTFRLLEEVTRDVTVSDADVTEAFAERREQLALPERRRLRHLVVGSEAEAQAALSRLRGGAAFPTVAMAVSLDLQTKAQGGELGSLTAEQLEDAFRRAAFATAPGQLFGPVQTRFGWHVGLVEEVMPSRQLTFDEAREALRDRLLTERKLAAQRTFVAKALREADVCYAGRFRPADPTSPPPTDLAPPGAPPPSTGP
jgi:peptidyl-prolyl cis-trans isomerase C